MPARNYRIRIVRGDEQLEAEGDKAFVLNMLKQFTPGGAATTPPGGGRTRAAPSPAAAPARTSGKSLSVGEFVRQYGFKKHTDLVLAFGYYLEKYAGVDRFTSADISNCYYEAKLETSNTSQMISQNIKRSYMMAAKKARGEKGGGKGYTLTRSGEQFIEAAGKKASE